MAAALPSELLHRYNTDPRFRDLVELTKRDPKGVKRAIEASFCKEPGGLIKFVRLLWPYVEPARKFIEGWHIEAICDHLEAVSRGDILKLLINVPPGFMKSLTVNVFWPAWEWGPKRSPSLRYMMSSYSEDLTIRDNVRFRQVIMSPYYQEFWGQDVTPSKDQFSLVKVGNEATGWKLATSVRGLGTGERADRVCLDDPNSVKDVESDKVRDSTNQYFTEVVPTRLNDPRQSAIILIQQRTHEEDVTGTALTKEMGFEQLIIPMRYEASRRYYTSIGWTDPRGLDDEGEDETDENDGELAWPELYPEGVVKQLESDLGPFAWAGQMQQRPEPRGGAIFLREWWRDWPIDADAKIRFPAFEYVVASVDTAFTERQENDYSAMTVWGVYRTTGSSTLMPRQSDDPAETIRIYQDERPKVMLIYGWQKRLTLHGPPEEKPYGVSDTQWNSEAFLSARQANWGLVEWVVFTAKKYKIDHLLIETQAAGHSLDQELRRLHSNGDWGVQLIVAKGDKTARAYAVQHLFSNGLIYAPFYPDNGMPPAWCGTIIDQFASFPKTRFKDLVDSSTHALQHLRDSDLLVRGEEFDADFEEGLQLPRRPKPLYEV